MVCSVGYCDASVVHLCLQEGWTATLIAAFYGHLTVLRTLVEQYGGNLLHRKKVKCYMMRDKVSFLYVGNLSLYLQLRTLSSRNVSGTEVDIYFTQSLSVTL